MNGHAASFSTSQTLTHLQRLEAESIHIMREVVSESEKPVMLCRGFPTGGGRAAAAGIKDLPVADLPRFTSDFLAHVWE